MGKALMKTSEGSAGRALLPAVASGVCPGLGQLINRESDKALGIFVVFAASLGLSWLPLLGTLLWLVAGGTWVYAVADGYVKGKKRS